MKILHLTSWLSAAGGGIPPVLRALQHEQAAQGCDVRAAGLAEPNAAFGCERQDITGCIAGPASFGYSPELRSSLFALRPAPDILHVHGLWMYPGLLARKLSEHASARRIVSPHGMLEPWALQNSRWKKRLASLAFENKNLRSADCLHALCQPEADNFRRYGLTNPIAVIPNGVDLGAFANPPARAILEQRFPALKGRRWVLFLSRIHPKKGLPHLLHAWASILNSQPSLLDSWCLLIAGPDELCHEGEMKALVTELGLQSNVVFTGPLHGAEKLAALAGAGFFVLPSFSEGFSMAVLEAAAAGLPVMLTPPCNFPELAQGGGALVVAPDAAGCETGLRQLLALTDPERRAMGQRGRELIARQYTWSRIADQMLAVYRWLLNGGPPPTCVQLEH